VTVAIAATTTAGIAAGNPALFERQVVVRPALWGGSPTSRPAATSLAAAGEACAARRRFGKLHRHQRLRRAAGLHQKTTKPRHQRRLRPCARQRARADATRGYRGCCRLDQLSRTRDRRRTRLATARIEPEVAWRVQPGSAGQLKHDVGRSKAYIGSGKGFHKPAQRKALQMSRTDRCSKFTADHERGLRCLDHALQRSDSG
jgi:hypothetical protein